MAGTLRADLSRVSQPPPTHPTGDPTTTALPIGRLVRRRRAVPVLLLLGVALIVGLAFLHGNVTYYRVTSGSMEPTLAIGSRVAVQSGHALRIGDVVVFRAPQGAVPDTPVCGAPEQGAGFPQPCGQATAQTSRSILIKRIVAGPRDRVAIVAGRAVVNGVPASEPFAAPCTQGAVCTFPTAVRVPAGQYFLLGDNRGASDDSRFWGPVPASSIVGVVVRCAPLQTACHPL